MIHSRNHEQANRLRGLGGASHLLDHCFVIIDGRARSDVSVGPAVIENQLALVRDESLQVCASGVDGAVVHLICQARVSVQIKIPPIPVGITEDHVFEIIARRGKWLRTANDRPPSQLAARREAR